MKPSDSDDKREYKIRRYESELSKLSAQHDDTLTAETVVLAAKPTRSPLHDWFEWDDKVAGHEYRLVQARELIRACYTVVVDKAEPERTLRIRSFAHVGGAYRPIDKALTNDAWKAELMGKLAHEIAELRRRYDAIGALRPVYEPVDAKLKQAERTARHQAAPALS